MAAFPTAPANGGRPCRPLLILSKGVQKVRITKLNMSLYIKTYIYHSTDFVLFLNLHNGLLVLICRIPSPIWFPQPSNQRMVMKRKSWLFLCVLYFFWQKC